MTRQAQTIILASGDGQRFGSSTPKQFLKIAGKTILEHTIERFERNAFITSIVIVVNPAYYEYVSELLLKAGYDKVTKLLKGGAPGRSPPESASAPAATSRGTCSPTTPSGRLSPIT